MPRGSSSSNSHNLRQTGRTSTLNLKPRTLRNSASRIYIRGIPNWGSFNCRVKNMFHRKSSWEYNLWKINLYQIFSTDLLQHLENKMWFYSRSAFCSARLITKFFNSTPNNFWSPCTIPMIRFITRRRDPKNLRFSIYARIRWTSLKYLKTFLSHEIPTKILPSIFFSK